MYGILWKKVKDKIKPNLWTAYLKSLNFKDKEHIVIEKVVFKLHPTYNNSVM